MPAVSVLMVSHRATPFLQPALASVWAQTFRDFELVLVDNGAGLTEEILGEAGRDLRLRIIRLPQNLGIPGGHNAGVAAAQGEFIALLDHDDVMLPTRLERQVARLCEDAKLGLVSSLADSIDADGRVFGREFSLVDAAAQRAYTQYAAPVVTPAYTGRRPVFLELSYRPEFPHTADFDFLARASERHAMAAVPEVLLQYRHHPAQTTRVEAARIAAERCAVRLLTARRRAGRDEGSDWGRLATAEFRDDEAAMLQNYARQFLAEDFPVLAAYHARRCVVVRRNFQGFLSAASIAREAWHNAGPERAAVTRMFFRGPVKALGLRRG